MGRGGGFARERGGGRVRGERGRNVGEERRGSFERSDEDGGGRVRGARIRREGGSTVMNALVKTKRCLAGCGFFYSNDSRFP